MNLVVCVPGNNFSELFLRNILDFQKRCFANKINVNFSIFYSPNLYICRNGLLGGNSLSGSNQKPWSGKINYDYILWLDSDIIFSFDDFIKLYSSNKQVISGLYYLHDERRQRFAAVKEWDEEYFKNNGTFEWVTNEYLVEKNGSLFKVDHVGMGFMLMKAGVIENVEYPWFRPKMANFIDLTEICTEDVSLCHTLKEKNFSIWINPNVIVRHEKRILL